MYKVLEAGRLVNLSYSTKTDDPCLRQQTVAAIQPPPKKSLAAMLPALHYGAGSQQQCEGSTLAVGSQGGFMRLSKTLDGLR